MPIRYIVVFLLTILSAQPKAITLRILAYYYKSRLEKNCPTQSNMTKTVKSKKLNDTKPNLISWWSCFYRWNSLNLTVLTHPIFFLNTAYYLSFYFIFSLYLTHCLTYPKGKNPKTTRLYMYISSRKHKDDISFSAKKKLIN